MKRKNVNITMIPNSLMFDNRLSPAEYRMMTILLNRENYFSLTGSDTFTTYQDWLALNMGISVRTVIRLIKGLEGYGYITITKSTRFGHTVNNYQINWDYIERREKQFRLKKVTESDVYGSEEVSKLDALRYQEVI